MRPAAVLLLLVGCATAPPAPAPPLPDSVPRGVIESFCSLLHGEGMTSEVRVIRTTQPIINSESLQALLDRTSDSPPKRALPPIKVSDTPLPVEIPNGSCIGRSIDAFYAPRDSDVMVLELSAPFANPFASGQPGVLARFSLGNESPTWYWIPIAGQNGRWIAGRPVMLAAR